MNVSVRSADGAVFTLSQDMDPLIYGGLIGNAEARVPTSWSPKL